VPFLRKHYEVTDFGSTCIPSVRIRIHGKSGRETGAPHLYQQHVIEEKFRRCALEVSEDSSSSIGYPFKNRFRGNLFNFILRFFRAATGISGWSARRAPDCQKRSFGPSQLQGRAVEIPSSAPGKKTPSTRTRSNRRLFRTRSVMQLYFRTQSFISF